MYRIKKQALEFLVSKNIQEIVKYEKCTDKHFTFNEEYFKHFYLLFSLTLIPLSAPISHFLYHHNFKFYRAQYNTSKYSGRIF